MSKKLCRECSKKVKCVTPVVQRIDKTIEWVCQECWDFHNYGLAFPRLGLGGGVDPSGASRLQEEES